MKISVYTEDDFQAYNHFAKRCFGEHAQQSTANFITWLYKDNPNARPDYSNFLIARDAQNNIIGCMHKTMLPWIVDGKMVDIASLHDLMMDPTHRDGSGMFMLLRSFSKEYACIAPGVSGDLKTAYVKMKHQEIKSYWFRRILNPLRLAYSMVRQKIGMTPNHRWLAKNLNMMFKGLKITNTPSDEQLTKLSHSLKEQSNGKPCIDFDVNLLRWRFFSARGPEHVLIEEANSSNFAILSFGPRHGVTVTRIIELATNGDSAFLKNILKAANKMGASMIMGYSTRDEYKNELGQINWQPIKEGPSSYLINKKKDLYRDFTFSAAATDIGFEAFKR